MMGKVMQLVYYGTNNNKEYTIKAGLVIRTGQLKSIQNRVLYMYVRIDN